MSILAHTSSHLSTAVDLLLCDNSHSMEITDVAATEGVSSAGPSPSSVEESINAGSKFDFWLKIRITGNNSLRTWSCLLLGWFNLKSDSLYEGGQEVWMTGLRRKMSCFNHRISWFLPINSRLRTLSSSELSVHTCTFKYDQDMSRQSFSQQLLEEFLAPFWPMPTSAVPQWGLEVTCSWDSSWLAFCK